MFSRWASTLVEALYPGRCLLCGGELLFDAAPFCMLCRGCRQALRPLAEAGRCEVCSLPLVSELRICTRCREREFAFERNTSVFEYRGEIRELLYQFKFRGRRRLGYLLAEIFAPVLGGLYPGAPLVPAPANPRSVRKRGWDPMAVVAGALAKRHGFTVRQALGRLPGIPQKTLTYEQRRANLSGNIVLKRNLPGCAAGVVLIDDVFTTGATASECARVLKAAGAKSVAVVSLAIDIP